MWPGRPTTSDIYSSLIERKDLQSSVTWFFELLPRTVCSEKIIKSGMSHANFTSSFVFNKKRHIPLPQPSALAEKLLALSAEFLCFCFSGRNVYRYVGCVNFEIKSDATSN